MGKTSARGGKDDDCDFDCDCDCDCDCEDGCDGVRRARHDGVINEPAHVDRWIDTIRAAGPGAVGARRAVDATLELIRVDREGHAVVEPVDDPVRRVFHGNGRRRAAGHRHALSVG